MYYHARVLEVTYKAVKCYLFESQDIEKQMLDESAGTLYL